VLAALLAHPAFGASADDRHECGLIGDIAINACTRIINDRNELPREQAEAFNNRGFAFAFKGNYDRAIADHTEAIRLDPKMAIAYFNRGSELGSKGDLNRAIADLNQAISLDPKNAGAWDLRCYDRAKANRDLSQALADCNESLRLEPNDTGTRGSRGFVYLRLNRLDEAIADFDAALKPRPNTYWLYGRGIAKLRKGDTAGGNADITAAKGYKADIAEEFARWGIK
jgi:tetratricopeptide (TPR) repeat protein